MAAAAAGGGVYRYSWIGYALMRVSVSLCVCVFIAGRDYGFIS